MTPPVGLWVKICGVRNADAALAAVDAGADAVGVNFVSWSRRVVDEDTAAAIVRALPADFPVFGVFADAGRAAVAETVERTGISGIQFHGDEGDEDVAGWELPVIRAVRATSAAAVADAVRAARGYRLLLDSPRGGGSGTRIADDALAGAELGGAIVAGGLTASNVAAIVSRLRPYGVDTAGGVEDERGQKDAAAMAAFVMHARSAFA